MKYIDEMVERKPSLKSIKNQIEEAVYKMIEAYNSGHKVLICGNGGSSSDSAHIVGELMKSFCKKRTLNKDFLTNLKNIVTTEEFELYTKNLEQGLPTVDLTSFSALNTAFSNDVNFEYAFANEVLGLGQKGDVLIGITTSGNSKSVLRAMDVANAKGIFTIALTGKDGGKIKEKAKLSIISKESETYKIQEDHISIYHAICLDIEDKLF